MKRTALQDTAAQFLATQTRRPREGADVAWGERLEERVAHRLRRLFAPPASSPVESFCVDLELVVVLQRCAADAPGRFARLVVQHGLSMDLWLFEVALACAGLGLVEEADLLLDALPGVRAAASGRRELLRELVSFGLAGDRCSGDGEAA